MIRVLCPKGHFIANVDINENGHAIPRGIRHGLTWGYAADLDLSCIRAHCRRCGYDGSVDYGVLCREVAHAVASGDAEYRLAL